MSQPQFQGPPQGPPPGYQPPSQPGYQPPGQPGYQPPVQPGYAPQYAPQPQPQMHTSSSNVVVVSQPGPTVVTGGCRACGGGVIEDSFTCCGVCLAICFFPLGIICCFMLMEKRCANCGFRFS